MKLKIEVFHPSLSSAKSVLMTQMGIQGLQAIRSMKRVKMATENIAATPCPMIYKKFKDPERAVDVFQASQHPH